MLLVFFKGLLCLRCRRGLMFRTRSLQSPTKSSKIFPTCHGTHRSLQCPRYPSRNFGTCPEPAINRRCRKCFFKGCLLWRIKEGTPAIGFRLSRSASSPSAFIVPAKFPNAVSSAANDLRNFTRFSRIFGVSKEPNRMPPHPFPWAFTFQIPLFKCFY